MAITLPKLSSSLLDLQKQFFEGNMQRANLITRLALAERMEREMSKLAEKYDGSDAGQVESEIDALFERKSNIAKYIANIEAGLKKLTNTRTYLAAARDAAAAGDGATFDASVASLNSTVGSTVLDPNNIVGNTGQGAWRVHNTPLSYKNVSTVVESVFMGSDYTISLDDGRQLRPEAADGYMSGDGLSINFADISNVVITGSTITFDANAVSYSGTLNTGGVDINNAWAYNNFATAADITNAETAIAAAFSEIQEGEDEMRTDLSLLKAMLSGMNSDLTSLTDEYKEIADEQNSAKKAERRAISARYELALNNMALSSNVSLTYIQNMFSPGIDLEKKSVFSIINANN